MIASATGMSMAAFAGSSFWAQVRTVITAIQVMLIAPSAASIAISPMADPVQHRPNPNPDPDPIVLGTVLRGTI